MFVFHFLAAHFLKLCRFKGNGYSITGGRVIVSMEGILLIGLEGSCRLARFLLFFALFGIFFIVGLTAILGFLQVFHGILTI